MLRRHSWFMPGEHVVLGAARERDLEDVLRLAGGEAVLGTEVPEAEPLQLGDDGRARPARDVGRRLVVAADGRVGDGRP